MSVKTNHQDIYLPKGDLLYQSELRILEAARGAVDSIRIIGSELVKIEEEGLYEAHVGYDFREYVTEHLRFDFKQARAWMRASKTLDNLEAHQLQLPDNQSQAIELAKLQNPDVQAGVWSKVLEFCDKENRPATYGLVRDAVFAQRTARANAVPKADIDIEFNAIPWNKDGEAAINRIRKLCGNEVAEALNQGNPALSERDLLLWSDQDAEMVKNLAHWIIMKRWSVRKALRYEQASINEKTTVEQLGDLARSRGGKVMVSYQNVQITVEIKPGG